MQLWFEYGIVPVMKIKQLIKVLTALDPEMEILVSKDAEGNEYNYLEAHGVMTVVDFDGELTPFDLEVEGELEYFKDEGYHEYPNFKGLIFWP